jgi:predicted enzyme related to lactoylglutathione lyase
VAAAVASHQKSVSVLFMIRSPAATMLVAITQEERAMGNPVVHFEITGKDGPKLQKYYSDLFGWKVDATNPMNYGLVDTNANGQGIAGGIAQDDNPTNQMVTIYVQVPDVQASLDNAVSLGGSVVSPVTVIPGMVTMAVFADPEGHTIGLVAEQTPPA